MIKLEIELGFNGLPVMDNASTWISLGIAAGVGKGVGRPQTQDSSKDLPLNLDVRSRNLCSSPTQKLPVFQGIWLYLFISRYASNTKKPWSENAIFESFTMHASSGLAEALSSGRGWHPSFTVKHFQTPKLPSMTIPMALNTHQCANRQKRWLNYPWRTVFVWFSNKQMGFYKYLKRNLKRQKISDKQRKGNRCLHLIGDDSGSLTTEPAIFGSTLPLLDDWESFLDKSGFFDLGFFERISSSSERPRPARGSSSSKSVKKGYPSHQL